MTREKTAPQVGAEPLTIQKVIFDTVAATLAGLDGRPLPPPKICVREEEAERLLGLGEGALASDRREARRGQKLKVPFVKFGGRVLYRVDDLRAALDRLPRFERSMA
jgi:hypothetical protein